MPSLRIPVRLCVMCKGARNLCGLGYCPLLIGLKGRFRVSVRVREGLVSGASPPTAIVGEKGYPKVRVYLGVPPGVYGGGAKLYDSPADWHLRLGLEDVIRLRSQLLHVSLRADTRRPEDLYSREYYLASLSERPVDMEAELAKSPSPKLAFSTSLPPTGLTAPARDVRVAGNPKLHPRLERFIWDDLRASEAVQALHRDGVEFYTIVRALALGFIGRMRGRRLVPTRWGITAVDSMISSAILDRVRLKASVNDITVYYSHYLHNKYTVIVAPGRYSTTWIEVWRPSSLWNPGSSPSVLVVRDDFRGRPSVMDGGFLAARTPVLEHLGRIGRQGRVVILREVEPQYVYPVGSWQIRLTVGHALLSGEVLRNPSRQELGEFLKRVHRVPDYVVDEVVARALKPYTPLDKYFKQG